jgi:hypothetical protein
LNIKLSIGLNITVVTIIDWARLGGTEAFGNIARRATWSWIQIAIIFFVRKYMTMYVI